MNGERFSFRSENNSYRIDDLQIGIKGYSLIQVKGHFPTTVFNDLIELLHLKRDGMSDEEAAKYLDDRWEKKESKILVNEGETGDYWCPTAANALRPLYQLIALSQMRPDGVWSEES